MVLNKGGRMRNCSEEAKTTPGARVPDGLGPHSPWELEIRWSHQLKLDILTPMPMDVLSCGEFSSDLTLLPIHQIHTV